MSDCVARQDRAVIMARGDSRRMGMPKGLCRFDEDGLTFVESLVKLYRRMDMSLDIVTQTGLIDIHRRVLPEAADLRILGGEPGGDTVGTLRISLENPLPVPATHLWAHPVDLPLVSRSTVRALLEQSVRLPDTVVRPTHQGRPGHPVVLPVSVMKAVLAALERPDGQAAQKLAVLTGPVRKLLVAGVALGVMVEPVDLPVADSSVTNDFDDEAALRRYRRDTDRPPGSEEKS